MANINIVYWSGTYNTKTMAELIEKGIKEVTDQVSINKVRETSVDQALDSNILVLGCPAMGNEVLQQGEMEVFMEELEEQIKGRKVVLFGSYGWGDGEWMRNWEDRISSKGASLVLDSLIVQYAPHGDDEKACIDLGREIGQLAQ